MSYNYRIGRAVTEYAVGKQWTFGRFTRNVWEELSREARRLMPDPLQVALDALVSATLKDAEVLRELNAQDAIESEKAKAEKRPPSLIAPNYRPLSETLTEKAYNAARRYLSAGSPELVGFFQCPEGGSYLFWALLKQNHPEITIEEAYDVFWDLSVNPVDPATEKTLDGRRTVSDIIKCANGTSPEAAKNGQSPA